MNRTNERAIAIWFDALDDVLFCVPPAVRLEVLHKLTASEIERREKPLRFISFSELDQVSLENWHAVKEAASLNVQVLVRSITNNHSPDDAAKVLFREHRMGTGSGWLPDYLDGLPGVAVDLQRCEKIADSNGKSDLAPVSCSMAEDME